MSDTPAPATPQVDVHGLIAKFVKLRDKIAEIKEGHKAQLKPYNEGMDKLEGVLMSLMLAMNTTTLKSKDAGTATKLDDWSCTVTDKVVFRQFLIDKELFELADIKANVTRVREHLEQTGELPPGVKLANFPYVGVRRAPGT